MFEILRYLREGINVTLACKNWKRWDMQNSAHLTQHIKQLTAIIYANSMRISPFTVHFKLLRSFIRFIHPYSIELLSDSKKWHITDQERRWVGVSKIKGELATGKAVIGCRWNYRGDSLKSPLPLFCPSVPHQFLRAYYFFFLLTIGRASII